MVSGEIAQRPASHARVADEEQAMMCGMFRNLGRHLAIFYLPELYEQMMVLTLSQAVSPHSAAERIFGLSLQKLGIGIAERWRLPKPIIRTMSAAAGYSGQSAREEDRLIELAEFSNELCDIVASAPLQYRPQAITNLLVRHSNLMKIDQEEIAELLQSVQQSFEQRYASLLGPDAKASRFSRNLVTLVSETESAVKSATREHANQPPSATNFEAKAAGMSKHQKFETTSLRQAPARPLAQRIQLAKVEVSAAMSLLPAPSLVVDNDCSLADGIDARVAEISSVLEREGNSDKLLNRILSLFAECLGQSNILVLKANNGKDELNVAGGLRKDTDRRTFG